MMSEFQISVNAAALQSLRNLRTRGGGDTAKLPLRWRRAPKLRRRRTSTSPMTGQPPDPPPKDLRSLPGIRWEVQLLGGLSVRSGDFEVPRIAERAVRLLLVRLALQPRI